MRNYQEAIDFGEKALANGTNEENHPYFPYENIYKYEMEKWKSMLKK